MEVEEVRKFLGQLSLVNVVALDELLTDDEGGSARASATRSRTPAPSTRRRWPSRRGPAVARAVEQLPEREKVVVSLYYFEA